MPFRVNHVNKKTGVTYVYESESYWDKELKQSRNRQVCVGKLDPVSGDLVPSRLLDSMRKASLDPAVTATARWSAPHWCWTSSPGVLAWAGC